jgi:spermidine/putrescine transport system ATP-binding protein
MNELAVELQDVSKTYGGHVALDRLSLSIRKGEFVVLLGPSGSGKTTLLSILGGFTTPTTGNVMIGGRLVTALPPASRPTVTVFQDYALFPHMTVMDNVAFGLAMRRIAKPRRTELAARALAVVGLEGLGDRRVHQLSGGQRQRVALARAIVIEPEVLLLDEPLGALDVKIRRQMQEELLHLQRKLGGTFIHVTHDQEEAMSIADTIVLLNHGRVEDEGAPERIYQRPASVFAASFMGETNLLEGTVAEARGDELAIETAVGRIVAKGMSRRGTKVQISIRPENIRLGAQADGTLGIGRAWLRDLIFQGTHRRCHAELEGKHTPALVLRLPPEAGQLEDGLHDLWVRPQDVVLIAGGRP